MPYKTNKLTYINHKLENHMVKTDKNCLDIHYSVYT
jgi:hypothetical protein